MDMTKHMIKLKLMRNLLTWQPLDWKNKKTKHSQTTNKNTLHHSDFFESVFIKLHSAAVYLQFLVTLQNDYYTLQSHSRI